MTDSSITQETQRWLDAVVVAYNFCPFAKRELDNQRVRFSVCNSSKKKDALESFLAECRYLDNHENIETSLLILPVGYNDFHAYLDVLDLAEQLLEMENYEGVYQVASFHPQYCFADADIDDAANFTNRSPYPMLHILREASLEKAIASHPDADAIPATNIQQARSLGYEFMKNILHAQKNTD
jgi:hypothetical protein